MIIEILEEAEDDIINAHDWYESKQRGLGADFERCIEKALERISSMPEAFPVWYRNTRRLVLTRFPYGIFFRIQGDIAVIVGVFHLKRNPRRIKSNIFFRSQLTDYSQQPSRQ